MQEFRNVEFEFSRAFRLVVRIRCMSCPISRKTEACTFVPVAHTTPEEQCYKQFPLCALSLPLPCKTSFQKHKRENPPTFCMFAIFESNYGM